MLKGGVGGNVNEFGDNEGFDNDDDEDYDDDDDADWNYDNNVITMMMTIKYELSYQIGRHVDR